MLSNKSLKIRKNSLENNSSNTQSNTESCPEESNNFQSESLSYDKSGEADFCSEVIVYPNSKKLKILLKKDRNGNAKKFEKKLYSLIRDKKNQAHDFSEENTVISDNFIGREKKSYLLLPANTINVTEGIFFGETNTDSKRIKK